eukprot:781536_1
MLAINYLQDIINDKMCDALGYYFLLVLCAICIAEDISGLIVGVKNDCDLAIGGESDYVSFGVNAFLLYGSGIHLTVLIFEFIMMRVLAQAHLDDVGHVELLCCVCCFVLFFFSWAVIGCLLYSEMTEDTVENKQCADATIAWAVARIVECVIMQPLLCYFWVQEIFEDDE